MSVGIRLSRIFRGGILLMSVHRRSRGSLEFDTIFSRDENRIQTYKPNFAFWSKVKK